LLFYKNYGGFSVLNDCDGPEEAMELLTNAIELENERMAFEIYKLLYPKMTESNYVSFEDFLKKSKNSTKTIVKEQSLADIQKMAKRIAAATVKRQVKKQ